MATSNTMILVVIGYSFPFFNRDVDRLIIGEMKNLLKVYIQDPYAADVKETFQAINDRIDPNMIIPLDNTKQFLLPPEL